MPDLGEAQPYRFEFVPAPPDLAPYLNSLYIWRTDIALLRDVLPAYSGQLVVFAKGDGSMSFGGEEVATRDAFVLSPLMQAWPFTVRGPAIMFGVSLNFRGWAALTGLDVSKWHDGLVEPEVFLKPALADAFHEIAKRWRKGLLSDADVLAQLAEIVRSGLRELPEKHAVIIDRTLEWLSSSFKPDLDDLYARLPYSERQVQRLVARFFGQSPIRLIRRYRAVRAATLLSMENVDPDLEAEIREAFYDQAHLIKELRFFTGRSPRRLLPRDPSVVHEMLAPEGYGAVDLFGGNQDEQLKKSAEG